jgi:hypothetical protein
MIRPTRPRYSPFDDRQVLVVHLAAIAVAIATCLAGPARADDVGELIQFQPRTPARADEVNQNFADVKTAVNTKTSDGIEFAESDSSLSLSDQSSQPTTALSATVTAPGPGVVKVDFSAYVSIGHTQGSGTSYVVCALKTDETSPESSTSRIRGSRRFVPVLSGEVSGTHYPHIDTMGVLQVPGAGSYTVHVVCYRNSGSNAATMFYRSLTATYHSDRL